MDVALLIFLILLNAVFAMSEMALTAARKARLQVMIEAGEGGAQRALDLHDNPTKFLSVVQIGITSIGILNGIVGEAAFSAPFAAWLRDTFEVMSGGAAQIVATAMVVVVITFLTIIFGELVPKRIGQLYPETVARLVAPPMEWLSIGARPFVKLLTFCTEATLKLLGVRGRLDRGVTEEEIAASLEEGAASGVIEEQEHQMVRNVFRLDERQVGSMMIPRAEIVWLEASDEPAALLKTINDNPHSRYPVCRGGLEDVQGVIAAQTLLRQAMRGEPISPADGLEPPVFVPETLSGMELLENFRGSSAQLVFVVDEYGEVQGMIGVRDLLEAITGEFTTPADDDSWAVQRADGSWLFDGLIPVPELKDRLDLKELPEEDRGRYNTLAGMIMLLLGRLPDTADAVEWQGWRFEVVDLDGKRVDKVLASAVLPEVAEGRPEVNDKTIHSALYRNPVPIDPALHRHLRLGTFSDFSITSQMHAVYIAATEFPLAVLDFTIVFVEMGELPSPIVLLGLAQNENLYLDGTRWDARYIPAFIRRYPFLPASIRGGAQVAVMFDAGWSGVSQTEGEPLFLEGDQPAPALQRATDFIQMFETEAQRTRAFCQRLAELKLLKSMQVDATLPSGRHMAVDGFMTVDEDKLKALPDATVIELHRNGMLALLNLHLASLANMRHLVERKGRLPETPAAS